jgi:transposase
MVSVMHERCCGLDVHKKTVVACVLTPGQSVTRTFSTMTEELCLLADWLLHEEVTHVAMESTGVYWRPIYNLLEGLDLTLLVVNSQHMKAVPGRKTDVKDAEWIADLLRHGLLRGSYVPERAERELRELVRYRRSLVQDRAQVANRIQKVLEGANIKLASVANDVLGVSGRAMLEAMAAGMEDPEMLASLAKGVLRKKEAALKQALTGLMGSHQRFLLRSQLRTLAHLDAEIAQLNTEIAARLAPHEEALERLDTIPGVGRRGAEEIVAEIGADMTRYPTVGQLASWAKICPGNNESAGKRLSGRTGNGNPWLRRTLVEAAHGAAHARRTYLGAQYRRLAARRGGKRASLAVGHSILTIVYYLLKRGTVYEDLGANYFDERDKEAVVRRSVRRIQQLGYTVNLGPS